MFVIKGYSFYIYFRTHPLFVTHEPYSSSYWRHTHISVWSHLSYLPILFLFFCLLKIKKKKIHMKECWNRLPYQRNFKLPNPDSIISSRVFVKVTESIFIAQNKGSYFVFILRYCSAVFNTMIFLKQFLTFPTECYSSSCFNDLCFWIGWLCQETSLGPFWCFFVCLFAFSSLSKFFP